MQDVDGDDVRCRWAVGNECGGVCQTFPAALNMVINYGSHRQIHVYSATMALCGINA